MRVIFMGTRICSGTLEEIIKARTMKVVHGCLTAG